MLHVKPTSCTFKVSDVVLVVYIISKIIPLLNSLTHLSLASLLWDIGNSIAPDVTPQNAASVLRRPIWAYQSVCTEKFHRKIR